MAGGLGVRVIFSSARETADRVLGRLATTGTAVVSNDRAVRDAATRAGATAIGADEFMARVRRLGGPRVPDKGESDDQPPVSKKGNPRRLPKKRRAAQRALGRLGGRNG